jgi:hypothetical protein
MRHFASTATQRLWCVPNMEDGIAHLDQHQKLDWDGGLEILDGTGG